MADSIGSSSIVDPHAVYTLGSSQGETSRWLRQADELLAANTALIDRVSLRPADTAIDLGCGPVGIFDLLADRVSPGGRVVGLDADPQARRDGRAAGRRAPARQCRGPAG